MAHRPLPSDGEPAAPPPASEPAADLQFLGVVAALNEGVVIQRADGVIESCNPAAERILGLSAEQMMGPSSVDPRWRSVHEDGTPFPGEDHPAMVTLRTGRPLRDVIMGVHKPDGSLTWISVDSMVLRDADHPAGLAVFTSFTDITERRAAEQREHALLEGLERRAAELQAANQDLDHFAAAVAHDLRAPLRAIVGFLRVLDEADHIASDDAEGRALITRVTKAAARMGELIDALLELARISRQTLDRSDPVDLSVLGRRIAEELRAADAGRAVEVVVEPELHATGDPRLVDILLRTLLENAWKFTRGEPHARIELARAPGGEFVVRDNGVGFDMARADQLFRPFGRLHPESEFPGTGVGLATAERIIRRHGGTLRGEGSPGAGAAFYFRLPTPAGDAPPHA